MDAEDISVVPSQLHRDANLLPVATDVIDLYACPKIRAIDIQEVLQELWSMLHAIWVIVAV